MLVYDDTNDLPFSTSSHGKPSGESGNSVTCEIEWFCLQRTIFCPIFHFERYVKIFI